MHFEQTGTEISWTKHAKTHDLAALPLEMKKIVATYIIAGCLPDGAMTTMPARANLSEAGNTLIITLNLLISDINYTNTNGKYLKW